MTRGKSKRKTARQLATHAYVRAAQRYGICLDENDQLEIVRTIQSGEGEFVERQSSNRTLWRVTVSGTVLGIVYDRRLKAIATVIPPDDPRIRPQDEGKKGE
jgi:hypothetical protein